MKNKISIKAAELTDMAAILLYDKHISANELKNSIIQNKVLVAKRNDELAGWLRWNLFWDNTPFLNMLFLLDEYRRQGYGRQLVLFWEEQMKQNGHDLVITSTLSNESAQHFYRKLGYSDAGCLLLKREPLEIIFTKDLSPCCFLP